MRATLLIRGGLAASAALRLLCSSEGLGETVADDEGLGELLKVPLPNPNDEDVVAVARRKDAPMAQIAKDFRISQPCLHRWVKAQVEASAKPSRCWSGAAGSAQG